MRVVMVVVGVIMWIQHPFFSRLHRFSTGHSQIPDQTQLGQNVDEQTSDIELEEPPVLTGAIVGRIGVMVIVEAFAQHIDPDDECRLARFDLFIVGTVAPDVRSRIHQPGDVQGETVAYHTLDEGIRICLAKQMYGG